MTDEELKRLVDLERELHLLWQRMDGEARYARHLSLAVTKLLIDVRHSEGRELFREAVAGDGTTPTV